MINLIKLKCPNCGANLEVESSREYCYCSHCGTKMLVSNPHEFRIIDEAAILHEKNEAIRLENKIKEIEEKKNAEKENSEENTRHMIILYWTIFGFLSILLYTGNSHKPFAAAFCCAQTGILWAGFILCSRHERNKKLIGKMLFILGCVLVVPLIYFVFK